MNYREHGNDRKMKEIEKDHEQQIQTITPSPIPEGYLDFKPMSYCDDEECEDCPHEGQSIREFEQTIKDISGINEELMGR